MLDVDTGHVAVLIISSNCTNSSQIVFIRTSHETHDRFILIVQMKKSFPYRDGQCVYRMTIRMIKLDHEVGVEGVSYYGQHP